MALSSAVLQRVIRYSLLNDWRRLFFRFCPVSPRPSHFRIGRLLCHVNFFLSSWPPERKMVGVYAALLFGIHPKFRIPAQVYGVNGRFDFFKRVYTR